MSTPTIVFDLDGTLVDTAPDLIGSLNVLFAREGLKPISLEDGPRIIGGGIKRLIERGLAREGQKFMPAHVDALYQDYLAYYAQHIADRSRAFPGVTAALDALAARNSRLAICSNKLAWLSERLLDTLGLRSRFAVICGPDTFGVQKPDREVLRRTVLAAGGTVGAAVMIGDSGTDIATARAAGVPVVAVDFGYTDVPVSVLKPDLIISHFDQLPTAVAGLLDASA